jgi:hypothetical protein
MLAMDGIVLERQEVSFIDRFVEKYGPQNRPYSTKKRASKTGKYFTYPFRIIETPNLFAVEFLNEKRRFSCSYDAAKWIEKKGREARRKDSMCANKMVYTEISDTSTSANISQYW